MNHDRRQMRMTIRFALMGLCAAVLVLGGCAVVPTKIAVTDTSSGRVYETYDDPSWSKENMLGFNFTDVSSGSTVMLKSYEKKVITRGGICDPGSSQALQYQRDKERAAR